jgi:hypothetical protein
MNSSAHGRTPFRVAHREGLLGSKICTANQEGREGNEWITALGRKNPCLFVEVDQLSSNVIYLVENRQSTGIALEGENDEHGAKLWQQSSGFVDFASAALRRGDACVRRYELDGRRS